LGGLEKSVTSYLDREATSASEDFYDTVGTHTTKK
jgi:hypothetical protein